MPGKGVGFIDKMGKLAIEPQFAEAENFHQGLAAVRVASAISVARPRRDSLGLPGWGYIDKTGKLIIKPQFWNAHDFQGGLACVTDATGDLCWVNRTGQRVKSLPSVSDLSEDLASVLVDGKFGFVDQTGSMVIKPQFDYPSSFSEGLAAVTVEGKHGLIDKTGKMIMTIRPQFPQLFPQLHLGYFSQGLCCVEVSSHGRFPIPIGPVSAYCYVDRTGTVVLRPSTDFCGAFKEGLAPVAIGERNIFDSLLNNVLWLFSRVEVRRE